MGSDPAVTESPEDLIFDALRKRGFRGTPILQHRALAWQRINPLTVVLAVLVAAGTDAVLLLGAGRLSSIWLQILDFWLTPLLGTDVVTLVPRQVLPGWSMLLPDVALRAGAPSGIQWTIALLGGITVALASLLLPFRAKPLAYLLRLIALIQLSANLYFYVSPGAFPYSLRDHVTTLFSGSYVLMLLVPWILAMTFFPFDMRWYRKLALLVICVVFFGLFAPVWLALHAWIIHSASLVVQPTLYLLFGYPIQIFLFVCLYGWGMSWPAKVK